MFRLLLALVAGLGTLLASESVLACPFCQSTTAEKIREGIFNAEFGYHFLAMAAPFPVLGLIVWLIYWSPDENKTALPASPEDEDLPATKGGEKKERP